MVWSFQVHMLLTLFLLSICTWLWTQNIWWSSLNYDKCRNCCNAACHGLETPHQYSINLYATQVNILAGYSNDLVLRSFCLALALNNFCHILTSNKCSVNLALSEHHFWCPINTPLRFYLKVNSQNGYCKFASVCSLWYSDICMFDMGQCKNILKNMIANDCSRSYTHICHGFAMHMIDKRRHLT